MAHTAMAGVGSLAKLGMPFHNGGLAASPPQTANGRVSTIAFRPQVHQIRRCNGNFLLNEYKYGLKTYSFDRLTARRDHRSVVANSAQTRHFNTAFDPSRSNIPEEYNFVQPMLLREPTEPEAKAQKAVVADVGPYMEFDPANSHPKDSYWRAPAPEGSFMVGNTYAQRTRLTPLRVPESGATGGNPLARILSPFSSKEDYYAVEMEHNYGREWPRLVWEEGGPVLRPGFLQPFIDPDFAPYWLHRGIARLNISAADRVLQTVIGGLYLALLAAVSAALYKVKPALLAAVVVCWTRNTLSLAKWVLLAGLVTVDRLYLYWVFMVAKLIDGVFERHMPPVRKFCWANLGLWCIYLVVTPSDWPLLPGMMP